MPFSRLHRRQPSLAGLGTQDADMIYNSNEWHEHAMDFTSYTDGNPQTTRMPRMYNATSSRSAPRDYLRPSEMDKSNNATTIDMFNTGPFGFSDLVSMDSNTVSPLDISSASSVRSNSQSEKMCPLITGDTDVCEPSRCGPDAPCMNFTNILPIEECTSLPCIQPTDATSNSTDNTSHLPTRASLRLRRPMTSIKRSQTPLSTSSNEDCKSLPTGVRRPDATRTSSAPERPLSKVDKKQRAKQAHSLVEKKYRENLNTKLALLHTTLQNAQYGPNRFNDTATNDSDIDIDDDYNDERPVASRSARAGSRDDNGAGVGSKFRKSEVLDDAMCYVNQTEVEMRHMEAELIRLTERTKALEKALLLQTTGGSRSSGTKCSDCSALSGMGGLHVQIGT